MVRGTTKNSDTEPDASGQTLRSSQRESTSPSALNLLRQSPLIWVVWLPSLMACGTFEVATPLLPCELWACSPRRMYSLLCAGHHGRTNHSGPQSLRSAG